MLLQKLRNVINQSETRAGRWFDAFVTTLIIYSIVTLSVDTLPNLDVSTKHYLRISEAVVTILFCIEYLLRVATAENRRKYIFSFYGLIDLIAVLPFILALGFELQGLKAIRLMRIFRLLKLTRYNKAISRLARALNSILEELIVFLFASGILLYCAAIGIYYFENPVQPEAFKSIFHSLWWAVTTLTTVGYGDMYPITLGGKIFTYLVLMLGLGVIAIPSALFAAALNNTRHEESHS